MLASQLWVIVNEVARRWQTRGAWLLAASCTKRVHFICRSTYRSWLWFVRAVRQTVVLPLPSPPSPLHFLFPLPSTGRAAKCNQINKLPVVSEWRRETTTDSYACSAFTLPIAAAASNCATVQQQRLCVWQQQQWWACWMASNSKRCRP